MIELISQKIVVEEICLISILGCDKYNTNSNLNWLNQEMEILLIHVNKNSPGNIMANYPIVSNMRYKCFHLPNGIFQIHLAVPLLSSLCWFHAHVAHSERDVAIPISFPLVSSLVEENMHLFKIL